MNSNRVRWIPRLLGKLALAITVVFFAGIALEIVIRMICLLYTSPSPRD